MPKTKKTTEPEVSTPAEPKPARQRTTKAAVASHKHAKTKKTATVEEQQVVDVPVQRSVTHEEIATLAYSYWEQRGRQDGFAEQDWLRAEAELTVLAQNS